MVETGQGDVIYSTVQLFYWTLKAQRIPVYPNTAALTTLDLNQSCEKLAPHPGLNDLREREREAAASQKSC